MQLKEFQNYQMPKFEVWNNGVSWTQSSQIHVTKSSLKAKMSDFFDLLLFTATWAAMVRSTPFERLNPRSIAADLMKIIAAILRYDIFGRSNLIYVGFIY